MGGKSDKKKTEVVAEPEPAQPDMSAYIAQVTGAIAQQNQMTQAMMQNMQSMQANSFASIPQPTTSIKVDYDSENKKLKERLAKQVDASDVKRKGVLGTILTSIDDEPDTVKSLLTGEKDAKV